MPPDQDRHAVGAEAGLNEAAYRAGRGQAGLERPAPANLTATADTTAQPIPMPAGTQ